MGLGRLSSVTVWRLPLADALRVGVTLSAGMMVAQTQESGLPLRRAVHHPGGDAEPGRTVAQTRGSRFDVSAGAVHQHMATVHAGPSCAFGHNRAHPGETLGVRTQEGTRGPVAQVVARVPCTALCFVYSVQRVYSVQSSTPSVSSPCTPTVALSSSVGGGGARRSSPLACVRLGAAPDRGGVELACLVVWRLGAGGGQRRCGGGAEYT